MSIEYVEEAGVSNYDFLIHLVSWRPFCIYPKGRIKQSISES